MPTAAPAPSQAAASTSPAAGTTTWVLVTNPVLLPLIPLVMSGMPALRRHLRPLDRRGQVVRPDGLTCGVRIGYLRLTVVAERETLAPALQHAQVVVVGMVFHHEHDNVPDLR